MEDEVPLMDEEAQDESDLQLSVMESDGDEVILLGAGSGSGSSDDEEGVGGVAVVNEAGTKQGLSGEIPTWSKALCRQLSNGWEGTKYCSCSARGRGGGGGSLKSSRPAA